MRLLLGRRDRIGSLVSLTEREELPLKASYSPAALSTSKTGWSRGFRRSPSMRSTRRLLRARAIPRLLVTVVFPSLAFALENAITRGRTPSSEDRRIDANVRRKDSASTDGDFQL